MRRSAVSGPTGSRDGAALRAPSHAVVAAAVRDGLAGTVATPALLASVGRRVRAGRRRRGYQALTTVVLVAALVTAGAQHGARSTTLDASSMLAVADVELFVPAAEPLAPPRTVDPVTDGRGRLLGGWCGTTPLDGVPVPPETWSAYWAQPLLLASAGASPPFVSQALEQVLRFDDAAGAVAYAAATARSSPTCGRPGARGASVLPTSYRVPRLDFLGRPHLTLAVAPASVAPDTWYVRTVDVRGGVAVDVFALVAAPSPRDAGQRVLALLDVGLERVAA